MMPEAEGLFEISKEFRRYNNILCKTNDMLEKYLNSVIDDKLRRLKEEESEKAKELDKKSTINDGIIW